MKSKVYTDVAVHGNARLLIMRAGKSGDRENGCISQDPSATNFENAGHCTRPTHS